MKYICIALIRFYRRFLSPLKRHSTCRFTPTCSAYALEAYQKRGFFAGTILTVGRILRCNPFCEGGYDPVPERGFRRTGEAPSGISLYETDEEKDAGPSPARTETDATSGVPKNGKDSPG